MTSIYANPDNARAFTVEFRDLVLIDEGETFVYACSVHGHDLRVETVANPTHRELIDALLVGYKAEVELVRLEQRVV